jgi:hypothetical protein
MMHDNSKSIPWNAGYSDGYRLKPMAIKHESMPAYNDYSEGYSKGKSDKEFVDTYSDEAFGIYGGFDG